MDKQCIKCYIYGIGMQYNILSSYLKAYQNQIKILALVTTEPQKITRMDGKEIIRPCEMKVDQMDYVIVAIEQGKEEVFEILGKMGLSDKIIRSRVFSIPNFDLEEYLKLKNSRPSILANTCLGGLIYNKLGLKILSPTINVLCKNYLRFLDNYVYYLNKDIINAENDFFYEELNSEFLSAPRGMLDTSIYWQFIHADSITPEIEKWNKRRCRVNFENVIALMVITTDEEAYKFDQLPIERKLGFYYKDLNLKSVIFTPEWNDRKVRYCHQYRNFIHQYYGKTIENVGRIDWIKFLNGNDNFFRF